MLAVCCFRVCPPKGSKREPRSFSRYTKMKPVGLKLVRKIMKPFGIRKTYKKKRQVGLPFETASLTDPWHFSTCPHLLLEAGIRTLQSKPSGPSCGEMATGQGPISVNAVHHFFWIEPEMCNFQTWDTHRHPKNVLGSSRKIIGKSGRFPHHLGLQTPLGQRISHGAHKICAPGHRRPVRI